MVLRRRCDGAYAIGGRRIREGTDLAGVVRSERRCPSSGNMIMKLKLHRRKFFYLAAGAAALPSLPRMAIAQDAYPSRPIHVIVGFPPGTAADITARCGQAVAY